MKDRLTDQKYWENYYDGELLQKDSVLKIGDYYKPIWEMWMKACKNPPETVIEIGAYPGRYIGYLGHRYGLKPTGLDFNSDRKKIENSMKMMGIQDYEYIQADFFNYVTDKKYDMVWSNGFIEHFVNYDEVLDRHLDYLNDDGSLLIMIPNKNYIRKYYGLLLDKKNLEIHNLKCMYLKTFEKFAERNNLNIEYLSYYGGFGYPVHETLDGKFKRAVYAVVSRLAKKLKPWIEEHPSKYWSSVILGVFTKK